MGNAKSFLANKAKLGDITYYILSMKIKEVVEMVKIFSEEPEAEGIDIEELYQRDIDYNRIVKHIAPYLVNTRERFFGAVIVAAQNFGDKQFKALKDFMAEGAIKTTSKLGEPYREDFLGAAGSVGLLTFTGKEKLIALDGQHRVKALGFASGKVNWKSELDFKPDKSLAEEDLCVILLGDELSRSRKIFKDLNSNAKVTTKSENIIVNDDDVIACVTRKIANEVIGARLVNFSSNSLANNSYHFTTLVTIYKATEAFLSQKYEVKFRAADKRQLPNASTVRNYQREARKFWEDITEETKDWRTALADPSKRDDKTRIKLRRKSLLALPLIQLAFVKAYVRLLESGMEHKKAIRQLNKIDWFNPPEDARRPEWHSVCMSSTGKISNKKMPLAIRVIAYMAGEHLNPHSKQLLLEGYQDNHWNPDPKERDKVQLPPQASQ